MNSKTLLFLLAITACVFTQQCNNPLLTLSKIKEILLGGSTEGLLTTAQTYSSLPTCKNILEGKPSCCSDTLIQALADRWATFKTKMSTKSKEHTQKAIKGGTDSSEEEAKKDPNAWGKRLRTFKIAQRAIRSFLKSKRVRGGSKASNEDMEGESFDLKSKIPEIREIMKKLVISKAKCASALLKHTAATTCMACAADWTTFGISFTDGKVTLSINEDACNNLMAACADYVLAKNFTNESKDVLFFLKLMSVLPPYDDSVGPGQNAKIAQDWVSANAAIMNNLLNSPDTREWVPPSDCDLNNPSTSCNFICTALAKPEGIDEVAFNNLGVATEARLLQTSGTTTVSANGANTVNLGSGAGLDTTASQDVDTSAAKNIVASLAGLFAVLLIAFN